MVFYSVRITAIKNVRGRHSPPKIYCDLYTMVHFQVTNKSSIICKNKHYAIKVYRSVATKLPTLFNSNTRWQQIVSFKMLEQSALYCTVWIPRRQWCTHTYTHIHFTDPTFVHRQMNMKLVRKYRLLSATYICIYNNNNNNNNNNNIYLTAIGL